MLANAMEFVEMIGRHTHTHTHTHIASADPSPCAVAGSSRRGPCTGVGAWAFGDAGCGRRMKAVHSLCVVLRRRKGRLGQKIQTLLQCGHCCREVMYDSERSGFCRK